MSNANKNFALNRNVNVEQHIVMRYVGSRGKLINHPHWTKSNKHMSFHLKYERETFKSRLLYKIYISNV